MKHPLARNRKPAFQPKTELSKIRRFVLIWQSRDKTDTNCPPQPALPMRNALKLLASLTFISSVFLPSVARADADHPNPGAGGRRGGGGPPTGLYKSVVAPHWFAGDSKFWYRNALRGGAGEFVLVDAEKGVRQAAFDQEKLAAALSKAAGKDFKGDHLPFTNIVFSDDGKAVKFDAADKSWSCNLDSYECTAQAAAEKSAMLWRVEPPANALAGVQDTTDISDDLDPSPVYDESDPAPQQQDQAAGRGGRGGGRGFGGGRGGGGRSPDGKWSVTVSNYNLYMRALPEGQEEQITQDGAEGNSYGRLQWSPDSKTLTAWQTVPGERKQVYLIQSSPTGAGRAVETARPVRAGRRQVHHL